MGVESAFELGVIIRAVDYFTGPLRSMVSQATAAEAQIKSVSTAMKMMGAGTAEINATTAALARLGDQKAFANIATDLENIGKSREEIQAIEQSYMRMAQYQRDMAAAQAEYNKGRQLAMSGVGDVAMAGVGIFGIAELVKKAGEFQANMKVIQDSTGASTKEMQKFSDSVMETSAAVSKFNDMQVAQIAQTLTSGGFNKIGQAQAVLPVVSKFAESQIYEHKASDPIEVTKQAMEMSHLFGHYDPKSFTGFLDTFNKYSLMQPGDSTQFEQTLKYLAPTAQTMHMKESDIMALAAVDNTLGLSGSHGGTNSADMILRLIPGLTGKTSKNGKDPKALAAMKDLGFMNSDGTSKFFNKDGSLTDLNGMLSMMIGDAKTKNPMQLMKDYKDIFGIQGGNAASILSNPRSLEQLEKMQAQLGKTKSMEQINADLQKTPEGQMNLLKSNSMTLMLRLGQQLAISLNPAIASVNKLLGSMLKFSEAHPQVAKLIGDFMLFAVGGKLAEGVVKIFAGNFKMLGAAVKMFQLKNAAGELTLFGKSLNSIKGAVSGFKFSSLTGGISNMVKGFVGGFGKVLNFFKGIPMAIGKSLMGLPGAISKGFSAGLTAVKTFGTTVGKFFIEFPGKILTMGGKILSGLKYAFSWQGIVAGVRSAAMGIRAAMTFMMGPWGILIAVVIAGVAFLITHWSQVKAWVDKNFGKGMPKTLNALKQVFQQVWNGISSAVMSAWKVVSSTIMSGLKVVQQWWGQVWPEIYQVLNFAWKAMLVVLAPAIAMIGTYIVAGIGFIKGAWQNGWNAIKDVFKIVWDLLKGVIQVAWYAISGIIQVGLDLLTGHWSQAWDHIKSTFVNIWNSIKSMFGNLLTDAIDFGKNFVMMIAKGITGAVGNVVNAVKGVADKIKGFLGFHSPTKEGPASESDVWMPNMMKMMATGIDSNVPLLQRASQNAANTLKGAFSGQIGVGVSGQFGSTGSLTTKQQQSSRGYTDNSQINFQQGSIVINPQPGQDAKTLARDIMNELGKQLRKEGYRTGKNHVNAW